MTFGQSIERARTRCRDVLCERIAARKANGEHVIVEAVPRDSSGAIVSAPDGLKLPLRYDLAFESSQGKFETENADSVTVQFASPLSVTWEHTLAIEIHRLCWDYMQFQIPTSSIQSWDWLSEWFMRWFDVDEVRTPDVDGLSGVVHFVSDPLVDDGSAWFFVDFGSASEDAIADLFDTLVRVGVTRCEIGKKQNA